MPISHFCPFSETLVLYKTLKRSSFSRVIVKSQLPEISRQTPRNKRTLHICIYSSTRKCRVARYICYAMRIRRRALSNWTQKAVHARGCYYPGYFARFKQISSRRSRAFFPRFVHIFFSCGTCVIYPLWFSYLCTGRSLSLLCVLT